MRKLILSILILVSFISLTFAQQKDSTRYKLTWKKAALPAAFMIVGFTQVGHESKELQVDLREDFPFFKSQLDNVAQYIPAGAFLLNGYLPHQNFKSRAIVTAISYATMAITVNILKKTIHETRPDASGDNSFPSGHTATAFTGAELFHQGLKNSAPVLSYAAYPIAASVGIYRLLNNKHYLSDVIVGAGIGILSTKLAYSIYHPRMSIKPEKFILNFSPAKVLGQNGFSISGRF
ncbi:phosphatase PAP2 family protein [Pedobacter cryophilus]|uniref:Phosphatase PAP2 family protein n=1 Tax=Pedobacter cryophilus TaxID=2571271 RepID=A0A4U1C0U0_9SPHI|nr:phosphatase PAP2 family protein [Pedobacter cryophilus]TKB97690.1 phosphatase PAP2 family protein [Pedobacter cryophilus]